MVYTHEWLTEDEMGKIFDMVGLTEKYNIWLSMLYYPALRVSEAINVRVRDLNFDDRCIDVWGGKRRRADEVQQAPCEVHVLERIKVYCDRLNLIPSDYIMFSRVGPQTTRQNVHYTVLEIVRKAGIDKKISATTFRRSRAQHLLESGTELIDVIRMLRHRGLNSVCYYIKTPTDDDIMDSLNGIDDIIGV